MGTGTADTESIKIRGGLLARNTMWNIVGRAIPLLIAAVTMPYVIRHLGMEGFGILSLAWVIIGYFSVFDLGIGPATTKFVAEFLGKGRTEEIPVLLWTATGTQFLFGLAGGVLALALTPVLVRHFLKIPTNLIGETETVFYILAFSLPFVFAAGSARGALSAAQRFDLVNAVGIPASSLSFLIPAVALAFRCGLAQIVFYLVISRLIALAALLILCDREFPGLFHRVTYHRAFLRPLLGYGGWVTVSAVASPLFSYAERFFIAGLLSAALLGFYSAPYEAVSRVLVIPTCLTTVIFPEFSFQSSYNLRAVLELFSRSVKWMFLIVTPAVVLLTVSAPEILLLWLGKDFVQNSTAVFQILAIAYGLSAFSPLATAMFYGLGRPDVRAKTDLLLVPIYCGLSYVLILRMGIVGAALAALLLRLGNDVLLFWLSTKILRISMRVLITKVFGRASLVSGIYVLVAYGLYLVSHSFITSLVLSTLCAGAYLIVFWTYLLEGDERLAIMRVLNRTFKWRPAIQGGIE